MIETDLLAHCSRIHALKSTIIESRFIHDAALGPSIHHQLMRTLAGLDGAVGPAPGSSRSLPQEWKYCRRGKQSRGRYKDDSIRSNFKVIGHVDRGVLSSTYLGIIHRIIREAALLWPMFAKPENNSFSPIEVN
jgi:hypothetical protein